MRIVLVNPPSSFLLDDMAFPPLGLAYLGAWLRGMGHSVETVDLGGGAGMGELTGYFLSAADWVGIGCTTPQLGDAFRVVEHIRHVSPMTKLMIGGAHATTVMGSRSERALALRKDLTDRFDLVVSGRVPVESIGVSSIPKLRNYRYTMSGHKTTSILSQIGGCPFGCGFCGGRSSKSYRVADRLPVAMVIREMRNLYLGDGYTGFMFQDDELNLNPSMVDLMEGIADLQEDLGVSFALRGFVRSPQFTVDQAISMKRAGFIELLCGFESADPRILKNMNKQATIGDNERMLDLARGRGLRVKALMSIGHPGETADSIGATKDWLLSKAVDDFDCTIITPYPGSPYWDEAVLSWKSEGDRFMVYTAKSGDTQYQREVDFALDRTPYKGHPDEYVSTVFTPGLTAEDIVALRLDVETSVRSSLGLPPLTDVARSVDHSMGAS